MAAILPLHKRTPLRHEISAEAREAIDAAVLALVKLAARRQALADHMDEMKPRADRP